MKPLEPAFNLLGHGPRFLQDLEPLEGNGSPPEMLFIDSAGGSTAKKNADLMVRRGRYPALPLPLAGHGALYAAGLRPRRRRGELYLHARRRAMVTLVKPADEGLWRLVWANVPRGEPLEPDDLEALPWMRATETSRPVGKKRPITVPRSGSPSKPHPEVFFGPAPAIAPGGPG